MSLLTEYLKEEKKVSEPYLDYYTAVIDGVIDERLREHKMDKIERIALNLSNYQDIIRFILKLPEEEIERCVHLSENWFNIHNSCSGRSVFRIQEDLKKYANCDNQDLFIGCLNELFGNCCIKTVDDL